MGSDSTSASCKGCKVTAGADAAEKPVSALMVECVATRHSDHMQFAEGKGTHRVKAWRVDVMGVSSGRHFLDAGSDT